MEWRHFVYLCGCYHTSMNIIKIRRRELGFSLEQAAKLSGIAKSQLWNLENGVCLMGAQATQNLREVLGLPGIPDTSHLLSTNTVRSLGLRPFERNRNNQILWERMEAVYGWQLRRLSPPRQVLEWMQEWMLNDSPVECLTLVSLACDGATGVFANPHECGYRAQCILDQDGLALGERLLPALRWPVGGKVALVWPQITVLTAQGTFRLDLLIGLEGRWRVVEIYGKTRYYEHENFRGRVLGRLPLVIQNADVLQLRAVSLLTQAVSELSLAA